MSHAVDQYYSGQTSGLPYFAGSAVQRGHGLGGIFSSIFRTVAPVLRKATPVLKTVARTAATEAVRTGSEILGDIAKGEGVSHAIKSRGRKAADRLVQKGASELQGMIKAGGSKSIKGKRKRRRKDIFSQ